MGGGMGWFGGGVGGEGVGGGGVGGVKGERVASWGVEGGGLDLYSQFGNRLTFPWPLYMFLTVSLSSSNRSCAILMFL